MDLIYVTGLAHSGSTALGIQLAQDNNAICLGEIREELRQDKSDREGTRDICSCKKPMNKCNFWSKIYCIGDIINVCNKETIVDTSKDIKHLKRWKRYIKNIEVYYVTKPALEWAISLRRVDKKLGRFPRPLLWYCVLWFFRNLYRELNVSYLTKGNYHTVLQSKIKINKQKFEHHIAYGNRMKYEVN